MRSSLFSKIAVLQSLTNEDMQTGKRLFEEIETLNLVHDRDLSISFNNLQTKAQFLECLSQLRHEAVAGMWPLLHIECHGANDRTGIVLADDSCLSWAELKPYLTEINIATRCNLLIVLGSCYGGNLGKILLPTDRAPCWGLIAPTEEIFPNELLLNFSSFYNKFLSSLNGDHSIMALLSAPLRSGGYYFTTAADFFKRAYASYLSDYCTPFELDRRARAMSRKIKKATLAVRPSKGAMKRLLVKTEEPLYENYHRKFFMIDLYPDNEQRFRLSFDEVKAFQKIKTQRTNDKRR